MRQLQAVLVCFAVALCAGSAANAQATRTWVSGVGNDADPCSRTAPCKTFAGAISKTFINGEINALDPGGFGTITITKSITINGDNNFSSILASGTTGVIVNIAVNANDPKRRVHLRNLKINGTGASGAVGTSTGIRGINFLAGNQLIVEDCLIMGFTNFGVDIAANSSQVQISNTTITDIGLSAVRAVGALVRTGLSRVLIYKTGFGFDVTNGVGTIEDSTISSVTNQGIVAQGATGVINVDGGVVFNSGVGVAAAASGSTVRIANLSILNNTTGISIAAGGTVASFGGNKNAGNTTPGAPNVNIPLQ